MPAQVKAPNTYWGVKYNPQGLALGLITPDTAATHLVAPGDGAGGAGIESSPPAAHFVTFAGLLSAAPGETMERLRASLALTALPGITVYSLQSRQETQNRRPVQRASSE